MMRLVLASGSPVRRHLLASAGFRFEVIPARVDEVLPQDAHPAALALVKAREVWGRHPDALVVGADQVLVLPDGTLAGKTDTREAARARITELSGHTHALVSAAAVVSGDVELVLADRAEIQFRSLTKEVVELYLDQGEWAGSAGSYLVESRGIHLMESVVGDHSTVLGLPMLPLVKALRGLGVTAW